MNRFNPSDVENGHWKYIKRSGIGGDASHNLFLNKVNVKNNTIFFKPDTEKVTWWAEFQPMAFPSPYHVTFQAKWYDPQGNHFFEEEFPLNSGWDATFVKTSLPIANTPAQHFPGLWQVEVYYQGSLIDKKKFHIMGEDLKNYRPLSHALPTKATVSEAWEGRTGSMAMEEDPFFAEHHGRAKMYFEKGMYEEARAHLNTLLDKQPFRTEAHLALAAVYFREEQWDQVLKELDYVIQHPTYRETALNIRSQVLEMKEKKAGVG